MPPSESSHPVMVRSCQLLLVLMAPNVSCFVFCFFFCSYLSFRLLGSALPLLSVEQLKQVLSGEVMLHYGEHVVSAQVRHPAALPV